MAIIRSKQLDTALTGSYTVSGSLDVTSGYGAISASNFSGSFLGDGFGLTRVFNETVASQSISTRITTAESELDNTLISGSAQIASEISGSFTSVSSSLAARLTSEEGEAEGSVVSSSAQIASDISGSWTSTRLPSETVSGSAQLAIDISGSWQGSIDISWWYKYNFKWRYT